MLAPRDCCSCGSSAYVVEFHTRVGKWKGMKGIDNGRQTNHFHRDYVTAILPQWHRLPLTASIGIHFNTARHVTLFCLSSCQFARVSVAVIAALSGGSKHTWSMRPGRNLLAGANRTTNGSLASWLPGCLAGELVGVGIGSYVVGVGVRRLVGWYDVWSARSFLHVNSPEELPS